jgi:hypothetical protein
MAAAQRFMWTPGDTPETLFAIPLPFDPKAIFGKNRVPVVVTINGYSYRTTVTHMGGPPWLPLRQSNRDAAGIEPGVPVEVVVALDEEERTVAVPDDLAAALAALSGGRETWDRLSFTHRREHVEGIEGAKKPETRQKRVEKAVAFVASRVSA